MIGISTANTPMQKDILTCFSRERYACVEYNHRFTPFFLDMQRLKALASSKQENDLTVTLHSDANDLCHPERLVADSQLQLLKSEIWFAHKVGIPNIVFHLPKYLDTQEILIDTVLTEATTFAKEHGVTLYLENDSRGPWADTKNIRELLDRHPLMHCLDVGHLNIAIADGVTDLDTHVKELGDKTDYLHLHDNDGKEDAHLALGKGTIDLKHLFSCIGHLNPSHLVIETHDMKEAARTRDVLKSFGYE